LYKELVPEKIETKEFEVGELGLEPIRCEIINVKINDPGMFRSKYSSYFIKTFPKGWVSERRFESFVELRNMLLKNYPGYIVPPILSKVEKKLEQHDLDKRKFYLEKFLNDAVAHPVLKNSKLLFYFLSLPSEKEYESKGKPFSKTRLPKEIKDFSTLEGSAKVAYDGTLAKYCYTIVNANSMLKDYHRQ